jgi:cobalt-zinc-cadmium efflux system outer membrane protein
VSKLVVAGTALLVPIVWLVPAARAQGDDFASPGVVRMASRNIAPGSVAKGTDAEPTAPLPQQAPMPPQAGPALTLDALEAMAAENHPALKQSAMFVRAAQGKYVQEGLYPNPVLGYQADEMGDEHHSGKQGAFLSQEIVTAGKLRLGQSVASHEVAQRGHELSAQRQRVLNDVRIAFYDVLLSQRAVDVLQQLCAIGDQNFKIAEQLYEAKEASRVDSLGARIEANSARLRLQTAKNRYERAWRKLATSVGNASLPKTPVAGDFEAGLSELSWESSLQAILSGSPELARARSGVQKARCAVSQQFAQRTPNVTMRAGAAHDNATGDNIANVEVGLPLPLFNRNQGNIAKAQAELVASQNEVERVELDLRDRLASVFQVYSDARQQVESYRASILPDAKMSLDLMRKSYEHGETNYVALLTAQRTYFYANLAYLESLGRLRSSTIVLEGFLLDGAIKGTKPATPGDLE